MQTYMMMSYAWCVNNKIRVRWPVLVYVCDVLRQPCHMILLLPSFRSHVVLGFEQVRGSIFSSQSWDKRTGEELRRRLLPLLRSLSLSCFRWLVLEDLLRLDLCLVSFDQSKTKFKGYHLLYWTLRRSAFVPRLGCVHFAGKRSLEVMLGSLEVMLGRIVSWWIKSWVERWTVCFLEW